MHNSPKSQADDPDLALAGEQWEWVKSGGPGQRWSREWALAALAAAQRVELTLAAHMDAIYSQVGTWLV